MNNYTLYVVEAPTLEPGQTVSTGGIRKDGKMVAQFRNPVPLEDQQIENNSLTNPTKTAMLIPDRSNDVIRGIAVDILSALWNDFGYPLLKSQLNGISHKLICRLSGAEISDVRHEVIEAEFETIPH